MTRQQHALHDRAFALDEFARDAESKSKGSDAWSALADFYRDLAKQCRDKAKDPRFGGPAT